MVYEELLTIDDMEALKSLFGELDRNVELIERELNISVRMKDGGICLRGEELLVNLGKTAIEKMLDILNREGKLEYRQVQTVLDMVKDGHEESIQIIK